MTTPRTILITGGNRGIGYEVAKAAHAAGHRVAVTSRDGSGPEGVLAVKADVTDIKSLEQAYEEVRKIHGPIEVVVANAGITKDTLMLGMSEEDFENVVDVNLNGAFRSVKCALKDMLKARFGRIIFISSVVGLYGSAGQVNYSSSKSALVGFARSLTREIGKRGITSNVIAPGFIKTDMTAVLSEDIQKKYVEAIPAGYFGDPSDIANAVLFLASEEARYISGAVIPIDGGLGMGH